MGLNRQSARRAVKQLEQAKLIRVERLPGRGLNVEILDAPLPQEVGQHGGIDAAVHEPAK